MGPQDVALEDKMVTICYGTEITQLNWINFAANSKDVAQVKYLLYIYPFPFVLNQKKLINGDSALK